VKKMNKNLTLKKQKFLILFDVLILINFEKEKMYLIYLFLVPF